MRGVRFIKSVRHVQPLQRHDQPSCIAALFRAVNRYVGNLAPMPGVFSDYPAPVIRNTANGTEMTLMRWGMPPPPRIPSPSRFTAERVPSIE
jgi:putative SOS response-associated peptidase YedK